MPPVRHPIADGRWHFQHGPIDIVVGADGDAAAVAAAHGSAWQRFATVLHELVAELPLLRQPVAAGGACPVQGPIARRMWAACRPHGHAFITPMAAVAGAVAQELIACYARPDIGRAWVNNGGDIALHLAPGHDVHVGLFADLACFDARALATALQPAGAGLAVDGRIAIDSASPVRGIATSGWRGRSFSLGIADSVTVLATTAAAADAAATVIANAVDADDARIVRRPADTLKDDSDLGAIPVTVDVPPLPPATVRRALQAGAQCAWALREQDTIVGAWLVCQGQSLAVPGADAAAALPPALAPALATPAVARRAPPSRRALGSVLA